jgi:AraC-like DNA-binding protein
MAGGAPSYASPVVAVRSYDDVAASDSHRSYHQIVLGIDGAMELAVDGLSAVVDATLGMVVPAGERHDYLGVGFNRQLVIDVPVDALTLPRQLFEAASLIPIDPRFRQWVMKIAQLPEPADPFAHWQAAAYLCDALLLRSSWQAGSQPASQPSSQAGSRTALRTASQIASQIDPQANRLTARFTLPRVDAFLRAHLAEPLSIAGLAAHCGCGVRTFHDRFVTEFGISPYRYLLRLRTEQAARLMNDARYPLADIAAATGFTDQSALTHAFVARFGITPGRWRSGRTD